MRYMKMKRFIGLAVLITIGVIAGLGRADSSATNANNSPSNVNDSPSNDEIAFAQRTSDLLLNELLAALFQEFNETTPDNVEEGKQAISLIFHNLNRDMRLIGAFPPLQGGFNDLPSDSFEQQSMALALQGQANTSTERVGNRWYYRRSVALSNAFHPACVLCHTNFTPQFFQQTNNPGQWVGALTLRVPIKTD